MVQRLSSRRQRRRELSVLLAQSATPATLSPAPCASCWPNLIYFFVILELPCLMTLQPPRHPGALYWRLCSPVQDWPGSLCQGVFGLARADWDGGGCKTISPKGFSRCCREVYCLKSLNHPNITKLFEVMAAPDMLYLVMQHVREGDLREHLENHRPLTSDKPAPRSGRWCGAPVLPPAGHRPQGPEADNILLDEDRTVKLADFSSVRR
ncbi:hypothetical protein QTO34_004807 [Cnephaeus nilssonii]|uniref:non-specific serine/threonine protein kinase n=1 Tax=Cnephaeus nilssonii TaxID=3371016 RepID=A0AA40HPX9_CNENI|nr:hypothetical protein QTO34_004807 [Eptesicus nilssonii]